MGPTKAKVSKSTVTKAAAAAKVTSTKASAESLSTGSNSKKAATTKTSSTSSSGSKAAPTKASKTSKTTISVQPPGDNDIQQEVEDDEERNMNNNAAHVRLPSTSSLWRKGASAEHIFALAEHGNMETLNEFSLVHGTTKDKMFRDLLGTPLFAAVYHGNLEAAEALVASGVAIDTVAVLRINERMGWHESADGWTPLMVAVLLGNMEMVQLLVNGGANLNMKNKVSEATKLISIIVGADCNRRIRHRSCCPLNVINLKHFSI
jgi:hypothetical protein